MIRVGKGVVRPRWADVTDDDEVEEEEEDVCITMRLPSGDSTYAVMEACDTIADMNLWIEKTLRMPRTSFVLIHNGEYLTRRWSMATLAPACVLSLTSRAEPRGRSRECSFSATSVT